MKLWIDTSALGTAGQAVRAKVGEMKAKVNRQVLSRGTRAVNQLRNAELEVLRGKGSGRVYRKPGGGTYRASAPGEVPARRTGNLRLHWSGDVKGGASSRDGTSITLELESQEFYADYMEHGTPGGMIKPRPFVDKIIEKATPSIKEIFDEPYV